MSFRILQSFKDLEPLVGAIQRAADSERTAFGFLPPDAYREFVQQGRAIAAVSASDGELAGYCLYGGGFPQAKVFQTYVAPDFRGRSIGERLLRTLFERLETHGFLSITANVASDLADANRFYEKMGFDVVTTKVGGKSKQRVINVRARELPTPSLLDHLDQPLAMAPGLSVRNPRLSSVPRYVIDLNVIFDVAKMRPRHDAAAGVIAAAMENEVKLAISAELLSELEKHTSAGKPDPILAFCRSIPTLKIPNQATLAVIRNELRPIVFPEKSDLATLKGNDESDLRHLATAIEERATGFITSDEAILRAAIGIKDRFGLSILSPSTFGLGFDAEFGLQPHLSVRTSTSTLEAASYDVSDREEVKLLLDSHHLSIARMRSALAGGTATAPRRRELVRSEGRTVAFASWDSPGVSATERELLIYADEKHPDSLLALRHLLQRACTDTGSKSVSALILKPQIGQYLLRKAAISSGFYSDSSSIP
ncbi:MAG: GNAT family N-acetyltransferase, partial [Pseudomonadota bacterium]